MILPGYFIIIGFVCAVAAFAFASELPRRQRPPFLAITLGIDLLLCGGLTWWTS